MSRKGEIKEILLGCDHGGYPLKDHLLKKYPDLPWKDLGTMSDDRVDYPDFADLVAKGLEDEQTQVGVLICGSGQGMAIRANRYPKIRAALCWSEEVAQLSRAHNNANVLCMGARVLEKDVAEKILMTFLETEFEGGRHQGRIDKLGAPT